MKTLRTTRIVRIMLVAGLALTTACAGFEPQQSARVLDSRLMVGNMAVRSDFELRNQAAAPQSDAPRAEIQSKRPVTPILFWLGVGLTAVGGVTAVSTGAASFATQKQLSNGYHDNIDVADVRTLENRGENLRKATIAGVVVTVVGALLTIATYGYDYTRCGPLAPKRRRDNAPPGRCQASDAK